MVAPLVIDAAEIYTRCREPADSHRSWDVREEGKRLIFIHALWLTPLIVLSPLLGWFGLLVAIPAALVVRSVYRQQHTRVELNGETLESWVNGHRDLVVERSAIRSVGLDRRPAAREVAGLGGKQPCPVVVLRTADGAELPLTPLTFGALRTTVDPAGLPARTAELLAAELHVPFALAA